MKTLSLVWPFSRTAALAVGITIAACGGVVVEPIGGGETVTQPPGTPAKPGDTTTPPVPAPKAPIGPYTGLVGTTDVSILYPLPLKGESADFVKPTEVGTHGVLLDEAAVTDTLKRSMLDSADSVPPSGYAQLALVSLRLDPCSARKGAGTCTAEVRGVFQAVYDDAGTSGPGPAGFAAKDGAVHVTYDIGGGELVVMMKQILTLKAAEGGLALQVLGPHPILAKQGLGGGFAKGLRAIILEHVGMARIGRITTFDHNMDSDGDGWTFTLHDKVGAAFVSKNIPHLASGSEMVIGDDALASPIAQTSADSFTGPSTQPDSVAKLVDRSRPAPGSPQVSTLQAAFDAAARVQNPTLVNAETTSCGNCHLAEGARLIGSSVYSLVAASSFTSKRPLDYVTERTSVTNLHAFGYLGRAVSIMQRTANESVIVADAMEQKVK